MTAARRLRTDEKGNFLVFFGISVAALLGTVALSFDLGRVAAIQTELQSFADSVALAAAAELDGNPDAINRATNAAALITDTQSFADQDRDLTAADYTLTFLKSIPSDDTVAVSDVTTDPLKAAYVQVTVTPHSMPMAFASVVSVMTGGGTMTAGSIGATAVAGYTMYACDITPLMVCLPLGGSLTTWDADDHEGRMVVMRSGSSWEPGNFGFLDPSNVSVDPEGPCGGLSGVNLTVCLIGATETISQCFSTRGVDTDTGQSRGIEDSVFNVRFDIYHTMLQGERTDPYYAPAPNTVSQYLREERGGKACVTNNMQVDPETLALPVDDCLAAGNCPPFGSDTTGIRFGDGNWSNGRLAYVQANYGDGDPATNDDPHPSAETRYEYYLAEIAAREASAATRILPPTTLSGATRVQTGLPQCSNQSAAGPERRVIVVAGIDCAAHQIQGKTLGVPVEQYIEVFLVQPVGGGTSPEIYGEIIGAAERQGESGGIINEFVQLYR